MLVQAPQLLDNLNRLPTTTPLNMNLAGPGDVNAPIDVNVHTHRDEGDNSAGVSEELDEEDVKPSVSGRKRDAQGGEESQSGRKKLKLSKEQAELLEKAFRENNTLNPVRFSDFFQGL
jgi:hypothetical protein